MNTNRHNSWPTGRHSAQTTRFLLSGA